MIDIEALALPDVALIDAIGLPVDEALRLLAQCGLGEARLLLRTPAELSDGQRYRFRLALAVARIATASPCRPLPLSPCHSASGETGRPGDKATRGVGDTSWILADEFTATLDRTLAKVVAFNVRRLADRTGLGFLLATTHEDIVADLAPDVHVRCRLEGAITVARQRSWIRKNSALEGADSTSSELLRVQLRTEASPGREFGDTGPTPFNETRRPGEGETRGFTTETSSPCPLVAPIPRLTSGARQVSGARPRRISFFDELTITTGTKSDWQHFARWHYRSHHLGFVRQVKLLRHDGEPIGICVFVSPPTSLKARNRYFGRSGRWDRASLQALNRQLILLSRVVLHPTYRGAGLAAWFVRQCCQASGYRWIETLAQMGHINPLFERAGFVRVGSSTSPGGRSRAAHSALYGNRVTAQTWRKSRHAAPVYYVFDNRAAATPRREQASPRRESGDVGDKGTGGPGDKGTGRHGDKGTGGHGDLEDRSRS